MFVINEATLGPGAISLLLEIQREIFPARIYREAPDDVFELIVSMCSDIDEFGWGEGGLNAFRLVNKRCKQVVESCTTRLTNRRVNEGPCILPITVIERCQRIEEIRSLGQNLRSLEGCPNGLKNLIVHVSPSLCDLSPLASCSMMENLRIWGSSIADITAIASMPFLECFTCRSFGHSPTIKDLSPLSSCPRLKHLCLLGNRELVDLSPLSACTDLEDLDISLLPRITNLASLSALLNLKNLICCGIDPETSVLTLASCTGLQRLWCYTYAVNIEDLMRRRPNLVINPPGPSPLECFKLWPSYYSF